MAGKIPSQVSQWCSEQLAGIFPDWLKSMYFGKPAVVALRFAEEVSEITRHKGHLLAPYSLLKPDGPKVPVFRKRIVDASLPQAFFLKRTIESPVTARKNIQKVVELDMVRKTPFRTDTVYWVTSAPERSGNTLHVEQWIAKQTDIEQLQKSALKTGLRIRKVFVEGVPVRHPIADFSALVVPNAKRWRLLNGTLALGAIVLAAIIWLYPAWQASAESARLEREITQDRTAALALRQEVDELRAREMERAAFLDMIYMRPRLSHALHELTIALPDSVWISDMNFSPERLVVSGEVSGSAARLVLELTQNNALSNPRLTGPVARASNGAERFELTLDLTGAK